MLTATQFLTFLPAAILITLTPGPDNLMVLGLGMSQGRRQGMVFGLGCASGCITHTLLAALGVSALIAASPTAFLLLKLAGGGYLIHLGWQALRSRGQAFEQPAAPAEHSPSLLHLFLKGLFANAINPKVVMFFLAFLPQFVQPQQGQPGLQTLLLGLAFTLQAAVLFGMLGYGAGAIGRQLARSPKAGLWLDRIAGSIFVALGLRLIWPER